MNIFWNNISKWTTGLNRRNFATQRRPYWNDKKFGRTHSNGTPISDVRYTMWANYLKKNLSLFFSSNTNHFKTQQLYTQWLHTCHSKRSVKSLMFSSKFLHYNIVLIVRLANVHSFLGKRSQSQMKTFFLHSYFRENVIVFKKCFHLSSV